MDGNSSLERRYSFNMAQGNPVAESTHLNRSSFSWGSTLTPKHRSNSSICLNNTPTFSDSNNKSIASPKSKSITKIDARIAADVQSKGLASRIVKYHESGTRLNRSMSAHNLYSKPGQFPAVTLKKTNLPYRATKQELSMIRIPPPEKSSFYGNTISSLLRSSSVMGLQSKRTEDLSRENRPIIHPPPTENDMAPTRSVLDVLKEISRKRINSDDLEAEETSKKYCNRAGNDFVDTGTNTVSGIPHNIASTMPCQRYKRQRDCVTPHQSVQVPETTKSSPEQAKKRVCNYNNDITSSLSSSLKCKLYGNGKRMSVSHNLNQTMPSNLESYEMQKAKIQRYHDHNNKNNSRVDVRFENLEKTLRKIDTIKPITPIPATPCTQDQNNISGVPPKRTISEPLCNREGKITNSIQPADKPRLTLFNKKCDDDEFITLNESSKLVAENIDDINDSGECAGIPFVKPKKISTVSGLRNPAIERTQKSKLALMLSGLRGELYQNYDDELDSSKKTVDKTDDNKINTNANAVISALKSTSKVTTLTTVTSSSNIGMANATSTVNLATNTKTTTSLTSSTPSSTTFINKTSSPLVGLKLSQPKPLSENLTSSLGTDATKSGETQSKPNVPILGGFSFDTANTASMANATTNNIPRDTKTSTVPISYISTSSSNNLNFEQFSPLTSTSSSISVNKPNKLSINGEMKSNSLQFPAVCTTSFTISTTNANTPSTALISSKTTNTFTFGTNSPVPASETRPEISAANILSAKSTEKSSNTFNFNVPSTSTPQTTASTALQNFGTSISSASGTGNFSPSVITTKATSAINFGTVSTPTNSGVLNSTSFTFNTVKPIPKSEGKAISSSGGLPSASFNFGSNLTAPSVTTYGATNTEMKTHTAISAFSFGTDMKNQNTLSGDQNKLALANKTDNNVFSPNTSTLFGSQNFNALSTGAFGNTTNSSEKNIFNSTNTSSIFGSNSVKTGTQIFGTNTENKTAALAATTPVFGASSTNGNDRTSFCFGSKLSVEQTAITNASTASGGFSFSLAVPDNSVGGTFGFGSKASGSTNTPNNNTFGDASNSAVQNKNFTFGSSINKAENPSSVFGGGTIKPTENTSPGGFSFGSAMSPKTSTFTFGAGGNTFTGNKVGSTSNSSSGFTFGGLSASKSNEVSTNKPFSFGSPQVQQQQILSVPNNNVSSSSIFGSGGANKTAPPPPTFNFNTGSSTNLQSNAPTTNNMFAPTTSTITTGPGDRPIRRATRRLQK